MNFRGVDIWCPYCRADFDAAGSTLTCAECRRVFPVIAGIPDLRVFSDPYIDMDADRKKGLQIAAELDRMSFSELIDYYYSITEVVPARHARQYKRGLMAGVPRAQAALADWERAAASRGADLLEIGCGTGPLLAAAAPRFRRVAGVDIAFRWLVVAKKRLMEAGIDAPLICACAEALPFREDAFDRVVLDSAIEVVRDQPQTLAECHRVMRPGGALFVSTPNRYSIGPDPHIGVPAGGMWPARWLAAYARSRGAIPPKRRLLSAASLSRLATQAGFTAPTLSLPNIPEAQRKQFGKGIRWLISLYDIAKRLPITRQFLFWTGPLLGAVAHKEPLPRAAR